MENPPVFLPVKISWKGVEYEIPANRMMGCIALIEEITTLPFLSKCLATGEMPYAKISMAISAVLRYAGADVSEEQAYLEMFKGENRRVQAHATLLTLLKMMFPPEHLREMEKKAKKDAAGVEKSVTRRSRNRRTK
jgi:hypothetical protein